MASNVNPVTGTITDDLNNAWSYFIGQCTRFVAGALSWIPSGLGNANQWLANAQAKGLQTIGPTLSPPPGSVAVWSGSLPGSGGFGHVAEVVGQVPGGFQVAEENFLGGPGVTDVRNVTSTGNLLGFILPPGGFPNPFGGAQQAASDVLGMPAAIAGLPAAVGHGLANATGAVVSDVGTFFRNQIVALVVALVVAIVLWGGRG